MKHNPFISFIVCLMMFFVYSSAQADWSVTIQAKGKKINGLYNSNISIGVGDKAIKIKSPPKTPIYSCSIALVDLPQWSDYLATHIQQSTNADHMWVFAINPHGNVGGFDEAMSRLSWNPNHFGDGTFQLIEGFDGTGKVIIPNMKEVSSLDIKGFDEDLYFTIIPKKQ